MTPIEAVLLLYDSVFDGILQHCAIGVGRLLLSFVMLFVAIKYINLAFKFCDGKVALQAIACSHVDSMRTLVRTRRKYKEETIGIVLFARKAIPPDFLGGNEILCAALAAEFHAMNKYSERK
ncbi:MAG: hypothetical protein F6J93_03325 [Oscillatoria sp. SIO1A7]|nr:hypothetical protein [Oscillatoria sp. SIO1A7]